MTKSKFTTYLLYAIGEILLVVIGILIAVSLNNWNQSNQEEVRMNRYYQQILEEFDEFLPKIERGIDRNEYLVNLNKQSLTLLQMDEPDSLAKLKETLGALGTMWTINSSLPILEEFSQNGYIPKVNNDSLKILFRKFNQFMVTINEVHTYIETQYQEVIEPYFNEHINYSEIALEQYQDRLVSGGPKNDYQSLKDDLELWNILTFKVEATEGYLRLLRRLSEGMKEIKRLLEQEIKK